jgi:hypothetical protein
MTATYDKLFSLIAALGALLVFFGFKGVESFVNARTRAEETISKAEEAVLKANDAQLIAEEAIQSLNNFVENRYLKDNSAEINIGQGLVLREMAEMYRLIVSKTAIMQPDDQEYCSYLRQSLYYIDKVTDHPEGVDPKILSRAFIVKGNVFTRLGEQTSALKMAEIAFEKYDSLDFSAYFNAACYSCLLAEKHAAKNDHSGAAHYEGLSIKYLRQAIKLRDDFREIAKKDTDFEYFRRNNHANYLSIVNA